MSELDVRHIASTDPNNPTGENCLLLVEGDVVYWQGEKIDSVDTRKPRAKSVTAPMFFLSSGEQFGNTDATKNTFVFRGTTLEVVVRLHHVSFNPETKVLTGV